MKKLKSFKYKGYKITNLKRKKGYDSKFIYTYTLTYPNESKYDSWIPGNNLSDLKRHIRNVKKLRND